MLLYSQMNFVSKKIPRRIIKTANKANSRNCSTSTDWRHNCRCNNFKSQQPTTAWSLVTFARFGRESCCCLGVSEPLLHGTFLPSRHFVGDELAGEGFSLLKTSSLVRSVGNVSEFFCGGFRTRSILRLESIASEGWISLAAAIVGTVGKKPMWVDWW